MTSMHVHVIVNIIPLCQKSKYYLLPDNNTIAESCKIQI